MARALQPSQRRAAKKKVGELYLEGMSQEEIASIVKVDQSTISRILKDLAQDWYKEGVYDFNQAKLEQLHRINVLEVEYWDAWRRSAGLKKELTETEREAVTQSASVVSLTDKKTKSWREVGDPRYLAGVQWCIEERCKILGLYAPVKNDLSANVFIPKDYADWIKFETERNKK